MEEFIKKLKEYINTNNDIEACLLMGSYVDNKHKRYDELSDVDLFIITEKTEYYLNNPKWLEFYKKVSLYFKDPISLGIGTELRVCFEDELLSDIAIVNYNEFQKLMNNKIFCTKIIGRGFKILKSNYNNEIYNSNNTFINTSSNITKDSLNRLRDEFIIDIYNILKYFYRNDYFTAFYAFERRISKIIIYILEESYRFNGTYDVMFNGRYMEKWLEEDDYNYIEKIFLNINKDSFLDSIIMSIDLFENKISYIANHLSIELEKKEEDIRKIKRKVENGKGNL